MRIYLVRHGETIYNAKKLLQGQKNIDLNENGFNQAKLLSEKLNHITFSKVFTSDLKRAINTAKPINEMPIIDKRLRERNFGIFEGKNAKEVDWESLEGDFFSNKPVSGESIYELIERTREFLDVLNNENGDILIVSHGGTMASLIYLLSNKTLEEAFQKMKIDHSSVWMFEKEGTNYILKIENNKEISK
mgnify:CR=1 FL=1